MTGGLINVSRNVSSNKLSYSQGLVCWPLQQGLVKIYYNTQNNKIYFGVFVSFRAISLACAQGICLHSGGHSLCPSCSCQDPGEDVEIYTGNEASVIHALLKDYRFGAQKENNWKLAL